MDFMGAFDACKIESCFRTLGWSESFYSFEQHARVVSLVAESERLYGVVGLCNGFLSLLLGFPVRSFTFPVSSVVIFKKFLRYDTCLTIPLPKKDF